MIAQIRIHTLYYQSLINLVQLNLQGYNPRNEQGHRKLDTQV